MKTMRMIGRGVDRGIDVLGLVVERVILGFAILAGVAFLLLFMSDRNASHAEHDDAEYVVVP